MATSDDAEGRKVSKSLALAPDSTASCIAQESTLGDPAYKSMVQSFNTFVGPEVLHSEAADKEGIAIADFLLKNAELIQMVEEKRKKLQEETSSQIKQLAGPLHDLEIKITTFRNWAGNSEESNGLMLYAKPETVSQVRGIIKAAGKMDPIIKVGFGGAYHSWTPLFPEKCTRDSTSIILNMCSLSLPESLSLNPQRIRLIRDGSGTITHVTIAPGVTMGELMEVFLDEGVCFESDIILTGATYGGVIPTGCHGVGKDQTILADWVTQVKIVDCEGEIRTYPDDLPEGSNKEASMRAIRMSMGVFGAVVEMTVKVEKMKTAKVNTSYSTVGSLLYGDSPALPQILRSNWAVWLIWFPFNSLGIHGGILQGLPQMNIWQPKLDEAWVIAINRDDTFCEINKMERTKQRVLNTLQHQVQASVANPIIEQYKALTPAIISNAASLIKAANPPGIRYEPMPNALRLKFGISLGLFYDMEFGFPFNLDKDDEYFNKVMNAMRFVIDKSKEYSTREFGQFPLSTTIVLRVINKSDCLISPSSRRLNDTTTHTAFVEMFCFPAITGTNNYKEFFQEVGQKWMELGGAPQWCKLWKFLENGGERNVYDHVHEFYGQNLLDYCEVLDAHCSSAKEELHEIFMNSTMKKLLKRSK